MLWKTGTLLINNWIQMVSETFFPFQICEYQSFCAHFEHGRVNVNKLCKYLQLLKERIEHKLATLLLENLAVMFDDCSNEGTHFVADLIASFFDGPLGCKYFCFGISPKTVNQQKNMWGFVPMCWECSVNLRAVFLPS